MYRPVHVIRLSWPVETRTFAGLLSGNSDALDADPLLARFLAILRKDSALGDFGLYRSVAEIAPSWEIFTPGQGAKPTLGHAGTAETSTNVMVTVHVSADCPADELDRILDCLVREHPWEVPVIEVSEARLLVRSDQAVR